MPATASYSQFEPNQQQQPQARGRMFWVMLAAVALSQLVAFWLLCSHQVRKAEARHTEVLVQQLALSDCLEYIPGSTIASCSTRVRAAQMATLKTADNAAISGVVPVSYNR